jgi:hypothetical protein
MATNRLKNQPIATVPLHSLTIDQKFRKPGERTIYEPITYAKHIGWGTRACRNLSTKQTVNLKVTLQVIVVIS